MNLKSQVYKLWRRTQATVERQRPPARGGRLGSADAGTLASLESSIPLSSSLTDRWDQEWLTYFLSEDPRPFFLPHDQLESAGDVRGKQPVEVYHTQLFREKHFGLLPPLCIWSPGEGLIDQHILEVGCGPGLLGKQLGRIAASYMGIDYSQFALHIARLTSPRNCLYHHISELEQIAAHAGTIDAMVGRFFFIHQNYTNLLWLLELAATLLKPQGRVCADFYLGNPDLPQGIVHPARSELDPRYPSCAFEYTTSEVEAAAAQQGFTVESVTDSLDLQRRFAVLVRGG